MHDVQMALDVGESLEIYDYEHSNKVFVLKDTDGALVVSIEKCGENQDMISLQVRDRLESIGTQTGEPLIDLIKPTLHPE